MMNPHEQEIKQRRQKTCMGEQGAPRKFQMEERNLQDVEKGTGHVEGL